MDIDNMSQDELKNELLKAFESMPRDVQEQELIKMQKRAERVQFLSYVMNQ